MNRQNTPLTEYQRSIIQFLHRKGRSPAEIAEEPDLQRQNGTKINVQTVKFWIKRYEEVGNVKVLPRSGRPKVLKEKKKEDELLNYIRSHPRIKYREVRRRKKLWKIGISTRTLNNIALRAGINAYRAVRKPPLSPEGMAERLAFARSLLNEKSSFEKMIFSDEKLFKGNATNRVVLVRREKSKKRENLAYKPQYIETLRRSSANSDCNIWIWIHAGGKGGIECAENIRYFDCNGRKRPDAPPGKVPGFDNASYTAMLDRVIPDFNKVLLDYIFIQDNSPVHVGEPNPGHTTADILRRHNVETRKFPPNSPDLHPVEHALKLLQDEYNEEVDKRNRKPTTKAQTFALLKFCWNKLPNEKIIKIHQSMRSKCEKCVQAEGNNNFKG